MSDNLIRLGLDGKLFVGTAGSQAATEFDAAKDVTVEMDKGSADTSRRKSGGWRSKKGTLKELAIEITVPNDSNDPNIATFRDAFMNNTGVSLWARDHASGNGPDADFHVMKFGRGENLEDAQEYTIRCEATDEYGRNPDWN